MGDLVTHPGFRDVLWDFMCSPEVDGHYLVRVCPSEEELFDREADSSLPTDEWVLPSGLLPTGSLRSVPRLDDSMIDAVGRRIWSTLPDRLRQSMESAPPLPVRLKISGESDSIALFPWECMQAASPPVVVVRSVPMRYPVPPVTVNPPVRVLLVATNPGDERLLQSWEELAAISPEKLPNYVTKVCERATVAGLKHALTLFQPHIVHYVGHGATSAGQGCLILHDEEDRTYWLSGPELAALLPVSVRLLCLSTCFTAANYDLRALAKVAHAPADLNLPTTLVNQLPLDRSSQGALRHFWNVFYGELIEAGGDVSSAFARAESGIRGRPDWASFSIVVRDGTGWSLLISDGPPAPQMKRAEFEALYSTSIANYITQQRTAQPRDAELGLRALSRREAQRASDALSSIGGFRLASRQKK